MTFTKEDIERLVPEATWNDGLGYWVIDGRVVEDSVLLILLTTRRQLEIAMEALDELARLGNAPNLGNSHGNIRAQQALESIKKVGES